MSLIDFPGEETKKYKGSLEELIKPTGKPRGYDCNNKNVCDQCLRCDIL